MKILMLWNGGFTFYGGFLFGLGAGIWYVRKHNLDLWQVSDMAAPGLALGIAFGRLGCFFSGDSFGKPTDLPWAVTFTDSMSMAPTGIPLHPTQIYSTLVLLVVFGILLWWQKQQRFKGEIFLVFIMLYSVARSFVEIFRNDKIIIPNSQTIFNFYLTDYQLISDNTSPVAVFYETSSKQAFKS